MSKQDVIEIVKKLTRNKTYQMAFAILISGGIVYSGYTFAIGEMVQNRKAIEDRIASTDIEGLKRSLAKLKKRKRELSKEQRAQQEAFKLLEGEIYRTHYPIINDILQKINGYAFNIHDYKLDAAYKKMDVTMEGSYQNLIRFIDFLGSIPAEVTVSEYKISLSETNMMVIDLTIEVEPVRI